MKHEGRPQDVRLPDGAQVDRGRTRSYTRAPFVPIMLDLQQISLMQRVSARVLGWRLRSVPLLLLTSVALAAPGDTGNAADLPLTKRSNLSPQESLTQSRTYQGRMQGDFQAVLKLQDEAQKRKDVIKLNCVNDKLTQIRGHLAVADRSLASLTEYVKQNDEGGRQHEFTRMTILFQKVEGLRAEAQTCVGEDIPVLGKDQLEVEIDPNLPSGDPADYPSPPLYPPLRPTQASPST